ncbi:hypothetical protein B0H10DRAFT_2008885 [Mycena sp. CBHHK59/15]|nr:hypothetical protein B0H10DRAFT_2013662 [Mycena sp. CBHHK59/15]KAJ6623625.1 hypothetical protein B0H10DRAFT_2008885 [Mycena sp. CBHHK59/15]
MTEWVPQQKGHNWQTKQDRRPANVDLFQRLDAAVSDHESLGVNIRFLNVVRQYNIIAGITVAPATDSLSDSPIALR